MDAVKFTSKLLELKQDTLNSRSLEETNEILLKLIQLMFESVTNDR